MYNKPITSRVPAAIKKASMAKQTKKPETPKPKTTVENLLGQDEASNVSDFTVTSTSGGMIQGADDSYSGNDFADPDQWAKDYAKGEKGEGPLTDYASKFTIDGKGKMVPSGDDDRKVDEKPLFKEEPGTPQVKSDTKKTWQARRGVRGAKALERLTKQDLKKRLKNGTITQEAFDLGITAAATAKTNTITGISGTLERQATQGINEYGPNRVIRKEATDPTQVRKTASDYPGQDIQSADEIRNKKKLAKTPVVDTETTDVITAAFQKGAVGMYGNTPVKGGSGINMLKKPSTFKMNGYGKKK
tara:strand:+ start:1039 stop:1947 length:909 start_codon:yes stop_codon:yes gene_type:complete